MARAFVLIDALPRREKEVFGALDKFPGIVAKRLLPQRVGQGDIIALVEAEDGVALERVIVNELRSIPLVHAIIRVQPHHTILGPVRTIMDEMGREADSRKQG